MLRAGARRLLAQAVDLEVEAFLADREDLKLPDGRARFVRHGHGPERPIQTGIGPVGVTLLVRQGSWALPNDPTLVALRFLELSPVQLRRP